MSEHAAPKFKPADDPAFKLPASLGKFQMPLLGGGLGLLLVGLFLAFNVQSNTEVNMPRFGFSAYLTAYLYTLSICLGCLFFVLIQHLVRAGWSVVVRRIAELMMIMIWPMAVLFLPILFAAFQENALFAWTNPDYIAEFVPEKAWASKQLFLNPTFFAIRAVVYFAIWCSLSLYYWRGSVLQDETGERAATDRMQFWSGPAVMLFALSVSFAAFDWGMSLAPMWFSTMFGVYFFAGSILAAHCFICVSAYLLQRCGAVKDEITVEHYHDLGKYMFGFIVFWTYIGFSQYLLIWYGAIPEEAEWFYTRQLGSFAGISIALVLMHWLVPFFGTMAKTVRRMPVLMAFWAVYILIMHFIDLFWVVMPEARVGHHAHVGGALGVIACALCAVGILGLVLGLVLRMAASSHVVPVRDPRLRESIAFENF